MEFKDYFLKLENGQKLKIFPYSPTKVFHTVKKYWDSDNHKYFITNRDFNVFEKREHFSKSIQHYLLCEYDGKIRLIKFGYKLHEIISSYMTLNILPIFNFNPFIEFSIYLHVDIRHIGELPNYDHSIVSHEEGTYFSLNYYNSSEYKFIDDCMKFTEDNSKLTKHHDVILNLNKHGVIKDSDPLMRLLKFKKIIN